MNANIKLAIIELGVIANHAESLAGSYKGHKSYGVLIPAHMRVSLIDAVSFVDKSMHGLNREMALLDLKYIGKRIDEVMRGATKGTHVSDGGLMHLNAACYRTIDNIKKWCC